MGASAEADRATHERSQSSVSPPSVGVPSAEEALREYEKERLIEALRDAVYAVRNAAGISEWHKRHSSRPFDYEDFRVWADHWQQMYPVVGLIAAIQDRDAAKLNGTEAVERAERTVA